MTLALSTSFVCRIGACLSTAFLLLQIFCTNEERSFGELFFLHTLHRSYQQPGYTVLRGAIENEVTDEFAPLINPFDKNKFATK